MSVMVSNNYDSKIYEIIQEEQLYRAVHWYLVCSYGYYHHDESLVSDHAFDLLAKFLWARYSELKDNHTKLISREELAAGTLLLAREDYPGICVGAFNSLRRSLND